SPERRRSASKSSRRPCACECLLLRARLLRARRALGRRALGRRALGPRKLVDLLLERRHPLLEHRELLDALREVVDPLRQAGARLEDALRGGHVLPDHRLASVRELADEVLSLRHQREPTRRRRRTASSRTRVTV